MMNFEVIIVQLCQPKTLDHRSDRYWHLHSPSTKAVSVEFHRSIFSDSILSKGVVWEVQVSTLSM